MRIHLSLGSWGRLVTVIKIAMAYFKAKAFAKLTFAKTSGTVYMAKAVYLTQQDGRKDSKTLVRVKRDRAITCVICVDLHLT